MVDVLPDLLRRAERDSQRLFAALAALVVVIFAAGAFGYLSLRDLSQSNHDVLAQIRADQIDRTAAQRREIAALNARLDYYSETVVPAMTAYLAKLARQVRSYGGDPGTLVIQPPPSTPSPSPSP